MSTVKTAIPKDDLLQEVPLFDIPESMDRSTLKAYRLLARLMLLRGDLSPDKARRLFDAVYQLHVFITVDLQPLQQIGARPVGDTLIRFSSVRSALIKEFNEIGLSAGDFQGHAVEIDHPANIQLTFTGD